MIPPWPTEVSENLCRVPPTVVYSLCWKEWTQYSSIGSCSSFPTVGSCLNGCEHTCIFWFSRVWEPKHPKKKLWGRKQAEARCKVIRLHEAGFHRNDCWMNCSFHLSCHIYQHKVVNILLEIFLKNIQNLCLCKL